MEKYSLLGRSSAWRAALCALALLPALEACSSTAQAGSANEPPEENRFTRQVLVEGLNEPMQIEFDAQGRVYLIERHGALKRFDESTGEVTLLGTVPVFTEGEGGLLGLLLDQEFETTRHLYVYYTVAGEEREARLSRFTLGGDGRLDMQSEIVMLRWPHAVASHMGGGMAWEPGTGNLFLSTGDNSTPTQYTPIHWTNLNGKGQDSQRSSGNTNDLRGKILRITPQPDGSYTIPEGNLFAPGTPDTRPEIYTMGNRNPWRLSVDSETGYLHWGEVGPDAGQDSTGIGPMGYDEFNVATSPGNYGWPFFIGYNRAYHRYDYASETYGAPFDPESPVNPSPNNTGLKELPAARPALLAYPYGVSEEFPMLSSGGRCAVGGPVFRQADFTDAARPFPAYYEGKWFVVDYVRNWIMVLTMNEARTEIVSMERFLPQEKYNSPIDMDFGPEGDLYVLEYGRSPDGRLSKVEYNAGNRAPHVQASADKLAGATPLQVTLSSEGTVDYDGDALRYQWTVTRQGGDEPQRFTQASPSVTLQEPGVYRAALTVTDAAGQTGAAELQIVAGNEPPRVDLKLTRGNRSFFFPGETLQYRATASDQEDGSLDAGDLSAENLHVTVEYVPAGMTPAEVAQLGELSPEASVRHARALRIMAGSDCSSCHTVDAEAVGPSFRAVAERYAGQDTAARHLSQKILAGGSGVWGEIPMPAHPGLTPAEATTLAEYVLSLAKADAAPRRIAPQGDLQLKEQGKGAYLIRATYKDRGANGVAPIQVSDAVLLRHPLLNPETAEVISDGISITPSRGDPGFIVERDGAHIGFKHIDLTGIDRIEVGALTRFWTWSHFLGGTVELRLGSPTGRLVGAPVKITPPESKAPAGQGGQHAPGGEIFLGDKLEEPARISVAGVDGVHDVYLVFRNPSAGEDDALLLLTGVGFRQQDAQ